MVRVDGFVLSDINGDSRTQGYYDALTATKIPLQEH